MLSIFRREKGFYKSLVLLAAPIVLQNVVNNALALTDAFMVGALGEQELAAVTLANNIFFTLVLLVLGVQSGMGVLISQYWGRGDENTINRVLGIGIMISGAIAGLFVAAVMLFPRWMMSLSTTDAVVVEHGVRYLEIMAPSVLLNSLSVTYLGAHRNMENPRIGFIVLSASVAVNTLLNYMLIFGKWGAPMMGVAGAALATLLSRVLELTVTIAYAAFNKKFRIRRSFLLKPGTVILRDFITYAVPVVINETLWGFGFMLYPIIVGHMPNAASDVAAYSITLSIDRMVSALFIGSGIAAAVIVGKRLGQGMPKDEVVKLSNMLLTLTAGVGLVSGMMLALLATFVFEPYLFPLFRNMSAATSHSAWMMLMICSATYTMRAVNFTIIVGILRCGGDSKAAAVIDTVSLYLIGLPLAFLMGIALGRGAVFVFVAMFIEESAKFVISLRRYRSKKWINNVTREM